MISFRSKLNFWVIFLIEAVWLIIAQVLGSAILLLPCLVCFLALSIWAAIEGMAMPLLLFFLPWSPLLKIEPGAISFYTIALLAILLIYAVRGFRNINVFYIIPALCIIGLTLIVKTIYGYPIDNNYILFCAFLLLLPLVSEEVNQKYDFYTLVAYFSTGIIIAAISAQNLAIFPTIARFITVHAWQDGFRLSGYYGDPNFYATHITAALGGAMLLLSDEKRVARRVALVVMILLLLYCGFLSIAKSFALVVIALFLLWLVEIMFQRGKLSMKITLLFSIAIAMLFILSSTLFNDLFTMLIDRLSDGNTLSSFTTGRTEIWMSYLNAFDREPSLLFFGQGYTDVTVAGRASHNVMIQSVFQLGLIGSFFLVIWFGCCMREIIGKVRLYLGMILKILILLVGTIGPWMALDYLFFDEFFLLPFYMCVGVRYFGQPLVSEMEREIITPQK